MCAVSVFIPDKNPAHGGDTVQSVFFSHFAELTNLIRKVKYLGSVLDQVSLVPGAAGPVVVPQDRNSTEFPDSHVLSEHGTCLGAL